MAQLLKSIVVIPEKTQVGFQNPNGGSQLNCL